MPDAVAGVAASSSLVYDPWCAHTQGPCLNIWLVFQYLISPVTRGTICLGIYPYLVDLVWPTDNRQGTSKTAIILECGVLQLPGR